MVEFSEPVATAPTMKKFKHELNDCPIDADAVVVGDHRVGYALVRSSVPKCISEARKIAFMNIFTR